MTDNAGQPSPPWPTLAWEGKGRFTDRGPLRGSDPLRFRRASPSHAIAQSDPAVLLRADARDAVRRLAQTHAGRVDLIYLDPPFMVGSDFQASIRTAHGVSPVFAYADRWKSVGAYLSFMHEILLGCHQLLADDGSLYLHVDQRTSHWLRCILEEVFGPDRGRGVIAWLLGNGAKAREQWGCAHNDILCFSKGDTFKLRTDRAALREPFAEGSLNTHFRQVDDDGRLFRLRRINGREYRYYADQGRVVGSVWSDCPSMSARSPILGQSTGYPTQKPERLLERIIEASSDPGDLVLDLFCGSGTTPTMAQRLARRWIAGDVGALAIETTLARLLTEPGGVDVDVIDLSSAADTIAPDLESDLALRVDGVDTHVNRVTCTVAESCSSESADNEAAFRYQPEALLAASFRSVVLASPFVVAAELAADGALTWQCAGRRLRPAADGRHTAVPVDAESIASWSIRSVPSGHVLAAGRGEPPAQINLPDLPADQTPLLRVVDAYGFAGEGPVQRLAGAGLREQESP